MFSEVQLAFLDYDRTLYSHGYPYPGDECLDYYTECLQCLTNKGLAEKYRNSKPLPCMKWLVAMLQKNEVPIYTLTHEIFSLRDDWKKETAKLDYGITRYISVDSPDHKVDMIRAISDVYGVKLRNCLFVDDRMHTIRLACEAGIFGLHVSNIAQMYESINK